MYVKIKKLQKAQYNQMQLAKRWTFETRFVATLGSNIERLMLKFVRLEDWWPPMCVTIAGHFSYLLIMFLKAEDPSKEFQNSKSYSIGTNAITNLLEVSPTFCKHVIIIDLDNSGWICELGEKVSLLHGCIAFVVIELDVDALDCWNEGKAKSITKYETYNTKDEG